MTPAPHWYRVVCLVWTLLSILVLSRVDGCFERTVLDSLSHYIQPMAMDNRLYYYPNLYDRPDQMKVYSEPNMPKYIERIYTCLEEYGEGRVLVKVDETDKEVQYQCLRFKSLTPTLVRLSKTKLKNSQEMVNCEGDKYRADQAVLVSMDMVTAEPCPLHGGFQMLLHESFIIGGHCLDTALTYNPRIQFQCDGFHVVTDFGRDCQPPVLAKFQRMRRRHISHHHCIGSWKEEGNIKSVMLRMRDQPLDFWCIHYRETGNTTDILSVFITLDGRCVENAFHDEAFPKETSMFGQLVSYVPLTDRRCSDSEYLDGCKGDEARCFETDQCPGNCQRCIARPTMSRCELLPNTFGHWKTVSSRQDFQVDIERSRLNVSRYGEFLCRGESERHLPRLVYPVVQYSESSPCMPYYACAQIYSPKAGVLNFRLFPAWRDEDTGHIFSCKQTDEKIGYVTRVPDEELVTMVNSELLVETPCGFETAHKYPTLIGRCQLDVGECGTDCHKLTVTFDNETCSEHMLYSFPIDNDHICYANFDFGDSTRGILTYSEFSDRYHCWIYSSHRLFIASPADCNAEKVNEIFSDREAHITYDPAQALSRPLSGRSGGSDGDGQNISARLSPKGTFIIFALGLLFSMFTFCS